MTRTAHITLILILGLAGFGSITVAQAQYADREIVIRDAVDHDLYAAGREVEVRARVDGDVVAAGRHVLIDSAVTEDVAAAGRTVTVGGAVGGDVRLAGRTVFRLCRSGFSRDSYPISL